MSLLSFGFLDGNFIGAGGSRGGNGCSSIVLSLGAWAAAPPPRFFRVSNLLLALFKGCLDAIDDRRPEGALQRALPT